MAKVAIDKSYGDFVGIDKVIKGILKPVYNEATGKTTITGDGEVLYDVAADRQAPYFLLVYKKGE